MNISLNESSASSDDDAVKTTQIFFYVVIMLMGTIGNTLICVAILRRSQRKISEYFILNLATTDLVVSSVSIPLDLIERLTGFWPYGAVLCKIVYPFQTVLMAVSVATLLAMSLERYRVIIYPFKARIKGHMSRVIIVCIWIGSILLVSPYVHVLSLEDDYCVEKWPQGTDFVRIYTMSVFIVLYLCPLLVITVAYALVGMKLYRDIKKMKGIFTQESRPSGHGKRMLKYRAQRNLRIVKIFVAAVCAFALCFLPTHVMWLWHDFGSGAGSQFFTTLLVFSNILVYSNSCINPFIFGTLQTQCSSCKTFFFHRSNEAQQRLRLRKRRFSVYSLRLSFNSSVKSRNSTHAWRHSQRSPNSQRVMTSSRALLCAQDGEHTRHGKGWEHLALTVESNL